MRNKLLILFVMFIMMESLFVVKLVPHLKQMTGESMLDMQYYNGERFYDVIEQYGEEGLKFYHRLQLFDLGFIAVYGSLFYLLIRNRQGWVFPVIVTMTCDVLENFSIFILSLLTENALPTWTFGLTGLKFLSFGLLLFYVIWLYLRKANN